MHRTIQIALSSDNAQALVKRLETLNGVVSLARSPGESVVPPGDVVTVQVLNREADTVLQAVKECAGNEPYSVATSELASLIDPKNQEKIEDDRDEGIWEEMETGLRHQAKVAPNYLALMALGGVVATVGLVSPPVPQAIAFIASAMVAPGYEPLAKVPLGAVLGRWPVALRGLKSALYGYLVLIAASALTFWFLMQIGEASASLLAQNSEVKALENPNTKNILFSLVGGTAGMIMIVAYRRSVIAGPLLLLSIIPAASLMGAGLVVGEWEQVKEGFERLLLDVLFIFVTGALVVWLKQRFVHKRAPLV